MYMDQEHLKEKENELLKEMKTEKNSDGFYEIENEEQFGWVAYQVNDLGNQTIKVKLMRNLNMYGSKYTLYTGEQNLENIESALMWSCIGTDSRPFKGTIDGNWHEIDGLYMITANGTGLVGRAQGAVISRLGVGINSAIKGTSWPWGCAMFVGFVNSNVSNPITITDCYNLGTVEAIANYTSAFIGDDVDGSNWGTVKNCYNAGSTQRFSSGNLINYSNCYADITRDPRNGDGNGGAVKLTTTQIQSWAFAYKMNGQNMEGGWKFTEGEYPGFGTLDPAPSWSAVAQGVKDGFVTATEASTNTDGAYVIDTAEKLALFAYDVNAGTKTMASASLTTNIDLMGRKYGGTADAPIRWTPIGTADNVYQGGFAGPSVIANMRVEQAGVGGLFGYVGSGTMLYMVGLDTSCSVTTTAPAAGGNSGTAAMVGIVNNTMEQSASLVIFMCYSRASVSGHSSHTGAFVGQAMGTLNSSIVNVIRNSYAAGALNTSSGTVGALAGNISVGDSKGDIEDSYWDKQTSSVLSLNAVSQGNPMLSNVGSKTTAEMKSDAFLSLLNNGGGSWIRSDDRNNGYPSFSTAPAVYTSWEDVGQAAPAPSSRYPSSSITPGTAGNPYLIKTAEDLAWFAYQVNNVADRSNLCGELRNDINLYGSFYNGENAYDPNDSSAGIDKALRWVPIGSDADGKRYTGTFNGNYHTITAMLAKDRSEGNQGLFGTLGDNAVIKKTGISNSWIEAGSAGGGGGIAGYVRGTNVVITECGNKEGSLGGSGLFSGGCVGLANGESSLILDGCYNEGNISVPDGMTLGGIIGNVPSGNAHRVVIRNCMNRGKVEGDCYAGGIIGSAVSGTITVTGCWNAGTVSVVSSIGSSASSIIDDYSGSADDIKDCLIDENYNYGTNGNSLVVKPEVLGTWGAAWRLNGGSLKQTTGLSWTYDKTSPYPVLNTTGLSSAESWEQIGEALEYGLLKDMEQPAGDGNTNPYQIQTAEQLAWFARKVNIEHISSSNQNIKLAKDINLFGETYTGYTGEKNLANIENALKWSPIGNYSYPYQGTLHGGKTEIDGMYLNGDSYLGLVGVARYPAKIMELGIGANSKVICNGKFSALFMGAILSNNNNLVEITSCYNLGSIVGGGEYIAAFVGDDIQGSNTSVLSNCYNAGDTTAFAYLSAGKIDNCYADVTGNSNNANCEKQTGSGVKELTTTEMKANGVVNSLNTYNGTLKTGTDRVWYTSLDTEKTKGYPTFQAPKTVKVTFEPDTMGADGKEVTLPGYLRILNMKLRAIGLTDENFTPGVVPASDSEFQLVAEGSIKGTDSGYSSYGYTNANKNVAVKAGTVDLQPVVSTASLNNPVTSLGTVDKVALNIAAAYTRGTQRNLLLEGASGNDRYEICIAIAGVTSKSLVVDLPVSVAMEDELMPDGTEKTAYSADTTIKNSQYYPMEGKILKAVPISKTDRTGYQALKPIARDAGYGSGQIYNAGVKLGITNPKTGSGVISGNLYYNPDTPDTNPWVKYQLKAAGGTLPYRYLVKYKADPYYDSEHPNFGYTISYQFGVMADDYSATAGAVAGQ